MGPESGGRRRAQLHSPSLLSLLLLVLAATCLFVSPIVCLSLGINKRQVTSGDTLTKMNATTNDNVDYDDDERLLSSSSSSSSPQLDDMFDFNNNINNIPSDATNDNGNANNNDNNNNDDADLTRNDATTTTTAAPMPYETSLFSHMDKQWKFAEFILTIVITSILNLVTIVGNIMVLISFKMDRSLQTVSNYFLLSLALADLLIGLISMPLYTLYLMLNYWPLGALMCDIWLAIDYLNSNAAVLNMLIISFDRYFSVTRPLTYRAKRTTKHACLMISCAWLLSLTIWTPAIFTYPYYKGRTVQGTDKCEIEFVKANTYLTFVTAILAFYIPVAIMIYLYWRIWLETKKRYRDLTTLFLVSGVGAAAPSRPLQRVVAAPMREICAPTNKSSNINNFVGPSNVIHSRQQQQVVAARVIATKQKQASPTCDILKSIPSKSVVVASQVSPQHKTGGEAPPSPKAAAAAKSSATNTQQATQSKQQCVECCSLGLSARKATTNVQCSLCPLIRIAPVPMRPRRVEALQTRPCKLCCCRCTSGGGSRRSRARPSQQQESGCVVRPHAQLRSLHNNAPPARNQSVSDSNLQEQSALAARNRSSLYQLIGDNHQMRKIHPANSCCDVTNKTNKSMACAKSKVVEQQRGSDHEDELPEDCETRIVLSHGDSRVRFESDDPKLVGDTTMLLLARRRHSNKPLTTTECKSGGGGHLDAANCTTSVRVNTNTCERNQMRCDCTARDNCKLCRDMFAGFGEHHQKRLKATCCAHAHHKRVAAHSSLSQQQQQHQHHKHAHHHHHHHHHHHNHHHRHHGKHRHQHHCRRHLNQHQQQITTHYKQSRALELGSIQPNECRKCQNDTHNDDDDHHQHQQVPETTHKHDNNNNNSSNAPELLKPEASLPLLEPLRLTSKHNDEHGDENTTNKSASAVEANIKIHNTTTTKAKKFSQKLTFSDILVANESAAGESARAARRRRADQLRQLEDDDHRDANDDDDEDEDDDNDNETSKHNCDLAQTTSGAHNKWLARALKRTPLGKFWLGVNDDKLGVNLANQQQDKVASNMFDALRNSTKSLLAAKLAPHADKSLVGNKNHPNQQRVWRRSTKSSASSADSSDQSNELSRSLSHQTSSAGLRYQQQQQLANVRTASGHSTSSAGLSGGGGGGNSLSHAHHPIQPKSERKAAKTLSTLLLVFIVTWLPYNVLVLIKTLSGGEDQVPEKIWNFSYYLCYINSTINPLCYALCNAQFRRTYMRILKCKLSNDQHNSSRRLVVPPIQSSSTWSKDLRLNSTSANVGGGLTNTGNDSTYTQAHSYQHNSSTTTSSSSSTAVQQQKQQQQQRYKNCPKTTTTTTLATKCMP